MKARSFISLKGAMKLQFMCYLPVVSILFSLDLYKSAIFTYFFGKTRFSSFVFLYLWLLIFSFALCFEFNVFLKDLITLYNQGIKSFMYLLILLSLDSNNLLNYKNCIVKTSFQIGFEFIKKKIICKEKSGTVRKVKLLTKIKKLNQNFFEILVLTSYCYCGDNT